MPTTLLFGIDGRLLAGDTVLAAVEDAITPAPARIQAGERTFEVHRRGQNGSRFDLVDADGGGVSCEFRPYLLRRGGRLQGEGTRLGLRPRRVGSDIWRVAAPGTSPIAIAPQRAGGQGSGAARRDSGEPPMRPRLLLTGEAAGEMPAAMLAFACWLILRWQETPALPVPAPAGG